MTHNNYVDVHNNALECVGCIAVSLCGSVGSLAKSVLSAICNIQESIFILILSIYGPH